MHVLSTRGESYKSYMRRKDEEYMAIYGFTFTEYCRKSDEKEKRRNRFLKRRWYHVAGG